MTPADPNKVRLCRSGYVATSPNSDAQRHRFAAQAKLCPEQPSPMFREAEVAREVSSKNGWKISAKREVSQEISI